MVWRYCEWRAKVRQAKKWLNFRQFLADKVREKPSRAIEMIRRAAKWIQRCTSGFPA
jgi:hypothetical protein